jgi:PPM family protein phosphatase
MLALELAILSERGGRSYNEDACGHWQSARHLCCVLADGAGGHGGGDVAARLAVKDVLGAFAARPTADGDALAGLLRQTNAKLLASRAPGPTQDMHTTVVCVAIDAALHLAHWAHAGDSRMYRFRDGRIAQRTRDHSLVQSLVDAKLLAEADMQAHKQRNELLSALGMPDDELLVTGAATRADIAAGDAFLLCTDGFWEYVDDAFFESSLAAAVTPDAWLAALAAQVISATRDKPHHDNFSALAVWVSAAPG